MALADVAKKQTTTSFSSLFSAFALDIDTSASIFGMTLLGPLLTLLSLTIASYSKGLVGLSCATTLLSFVFLLKWRTNGLFGSIALTVCAFFARVFLGVQESVLWDVGYFVQLGGSLYVAHLCIEEGIEKYEKDTLQIADDFEKLQERHESYTKEKASECERLKRALQEEVEKLHELQDERDSLKNVVAASSAQAAAFADKNTKLQQKSFDLHKALVDEKAKKIDIPGHLLKDLNTLRVEHFQHKKLLEYTLQVMHPLKVDPLPSTVKPVVKKPRKKSVQAKEASAVLPDEKPVKEDVLEPVTPPKERVSSEEISPADETAVDEKAQLHAKEKEKVALKKEYYEMLDACNQLKAECSQDMSNTELKKAYDEAASALKARKAALVEVEKELFSLKKELRDQGKLFS